VRADGTADVVRVAGQVAVATTDRIAGVRLLPDRPPARPEAVDRGPEADWVVLGPGSWYTSVIPHLLVPDLASALHRTSGAGSSCSTSAPDGETVGMGPCDHLGRAAAARPGAAGGRRDRRPERTVEDVDELEERTEAFGGRLLLRQMRRGDGTPRHDPLRLAAAISDVVDGYLGDIGPARGMAG
jgi:uncharacterized cofD-like protein